MRRAHVQPVAQPDADLPAGLRIGAAAREVGVSPSALRLWERQELVAPARTRAGYRVYSPGDLARLRQVRHMREQHVNASGIRRILSGGRTMQADGGAARSTLAGARLRELRRARGLSLREASRRAGLSTSFLSAFERGTAGASVAALQRLTRLYAVTTLDLFERRPQGERVVRGHERRSLDLEQAGVRIEQLAETAQQLEPQLFTLAAGASSPAYAHAGEEFLYVLDGELTFWIGADERYRLRAGDALTFPSNLPHRWRNRAGGETRLLWINTPPTF